MKNNKWRNLVDFLNSKALVENPDLNNAVVFTAMLTLTDLLDKHKLWGMLLEVFPFMFPTEDDCPAVWAVCALGANRPQCRACSWPGPSKTKLQLRRTNGISISNVVPSLPLPPRTPLELAHSNSQSYSFIVQEDFRFQEIRCHAQQCHQQCFRNIHISWIVSVSGSRLTLLGLLTLCQQSSNSKTRSRLGGCGISFNH